METISSIADKEVKSKVIDLTTMVEADEDLNPASTTTEIIAAVPGKKIVVVSIVAYRIMFAFGTVAFRTQWKSGSTAITGEMTNDNTSASLTLMPVPEGHFKTAAGEALNLTVTDTRTGSVSGANVYIDGSITYYEE